MAANALAPPTPQNMLYAFSQGAYPADLLQYRNALADVPSQYQTPNMLRAMGRGVLDLLASPYTGGLTPEAFGSLIPGPGRADASTAAIRLFHGSPKAGIRSVAAGPIRRQFENATSQFGAFFSPVVSEASRYAGKKGHVYQADFDLKNPYEMSMSEFSKFQSPNKAAGGQSLPGDQWAARADELKAEAAALRQKLEAAGHDGIVIKRRDGSIMELASFKDIPVDVLRAMGPES